MPLELPAEGHIIAIIVSISLAVLAWQRSNRMLDVSGCLNQSNV